jgi:dynactin complex subunit
VTRKAKIFDFDRTYAERFKPNPMCSIIAPIQCNEVVQGLDIAEIIGSAYRAYGDDRLLRLILNHSNINQFKSTFNDFEALWKNEKQWFDRHIKSLPEIIHSIAQNVKLIASPAEGTVYNCSTDRFYPNGALKFVNNQDLNRLSNGDLFEQNTLLRNEVRKLHKKLPIRFYPKNDLQLVNAQDSHDNLMQQNAQLQAEIRKLNKRVSNFNAAMIVGGLASATGVGVHGLVKRSRRSSTA